jgi:hypothetical protein
MFSIGANLWCLNMAKTCLKVLRVNYSRLRKSLSLEAFTCLEVWPLGHDGSVLLSVVFQALLCNLLVWSFLLLALPAMLMMAVSGKSRLLSARFRIGARRKSSPLERGECPYVAEIYASANMFYLLKHLLLNLVIFKLKCNNLIFNEIMVLNASFVCLLHSRFIEDHPI